jgi:cell division protein FtsB
MTGEYTDLKQVRDRLMKDLAKREKELEKLKARTADLETEIEELKKDITLLN